MSGSVSTVARRQEDGVVQIVTNEVTISTVLTPMAAADFATWLADASDILDIEQRAMLAFLDGMLQSQEERGAPPGVRARFHRAFPFLEAVPDVP